LCREREVDRLGLFLHHHQGRFNGVQAVTGPEIGTAFLESRAEELENVDFVLFHTGWSRLSDLIDMVGLDPAAGDRVRARRPATD
jgi:hypothetical protein